MGRRRWIVLAWLAGPTVVAAIVASQFSYVVLGSMSMEPWAPPGALVVHRSVPAEEVEVGDVVTVDAPGRGLVTHRVVRLTAPEDGTVTARLQGDRNDLPDAVPVELSGEVEVAVARVPLLGRVLRIAGPTAGAAIALLALGGVVLVLTMTDDSEDDADDDAENGSGPDPRIEALLATVEQLDEDGVPPPVLEDLVRVRTAAALGLPGVEEHDSVRGLGDGARFYVVALADADQEALGLVPVDSARRTHGSAAVADWWCDVRPSIPQQVHDAIGSWSDAGA